MSYPQQQPGMPPFGGQPQPAPVKQVSGKAIALVAAGIAAVGALIIGLIVGLSSGGDDDITRVTLKDHITEHAVTVSLRVPAGWQLVSSADGTTDLLLVRSDEPLTYTEFTRLTEDLFGTTSEIPPLQAVGVSFGRCPDPIWSPTFDPDHDGWQTARPSNVETSDTRQVRWGGLIMTIGDGTCLDVESIDAATHGATLPDGAEQLLEKVRDGQVITEVKLIPNAGASTSYGR